MAPDLILEAFLRSMRVLAVVTGILVVVDSLGVQFNYPERPPHRPRANAFAWLVIAGTATGANLYLLVKGYGWIGHDAPHAAKIAAALIPSALAVSFTARAVTRAHRPWLVFGSAVLMGFIGTILALAEHLG